MIILIKDGIVRNIRETFEQEDDDDYYKPKGVSNFWNNNYIEYESNRDKHEIFSLEKYLDKIRNYLK